MSPQDDMHQRLGSFSAMAAANPDVDSLLQAACQQIAGALEVSHVKAMEYLPEERALLIRAGVGWGDKVVGKVRLPAGFESAAGLTLQTGKPTIANDLRTEDRFHVPQLLLDHGVRSAVNCLIKSDDLVFGVLEADSNSPRHFGDEDVQALQGFANILALVVAQAKLAKQNYELSTKLEISLRELSHRTKNSNQMLMSIVSLQKNKSKILEVSTALDDVLSRLYILNDIDSLLTFVEDTEIVDVSSYINSIAGKIFSGMSASSQDVRLITDLHEGALGRAQAQALAIIINEFITNSFKHAFKEGGVLRITMQSTESTATLELIDDGPGIPEDATAGLGMAIIPAIAKQIGAEVEWVKGAGAHLKLTIPTPKPMMPAA
jgi:two-component sensor histidine kinase